MSSVLAHIFSPCTVRDAFLFCCDVSRAPSKGILKMLSASCSDQEDAKKLTHLASPEGAADYNVLAQSWNPTTLDLLLAFPSCHPTLAQLLEFLPALTPRYYSVTSSPCWHPNIVHVAFSVVGYTTDPPHQTKHLGLCTNWLQQVAHESGHLARAAIADAGKSTSGPSFPASDRTKKFSSHPSLPGVMVNGDGRLFVPAFMRRSTDFALPEDISRNVIMVGPGTGVAPFRGFLQKRATDRQACLTGGTCLGTWRGLEFGMQDEQTEEGFEGNTIAGSVFAEMKRVGSDRNIAQNWGHGAGIDAPVFNTPAEASSPAPEPEVDSAPTFVPKPFSPSVDGMLESPPSDGGAWWGVNALGYVLGSDIPIDPTSVNLADAGPTSLPLPTSSLTSKNYAEADKNDKNNYNETIDSDEIIKNNGTTTVAPSSSTPSDSPSALTSGDVNMKITYNKSKLYVNNNNIDVPLSSMGSFNSLHSRFSFEEDEGEEEDCDAVTVGEAVLFFGCRTREHDYLYKEDWQQFLDTGNLSQVHVAFSRETDKKVYVQDKLKEHGAYVANQIIRNQSYFFVCGDGGGMAKDVMASISQILAEHGNMTTVEADAYVGRMIKERRYVQDIWS
jgi:hypothetical protein